jgi:hypothetical protein
MYTDHWLTWAVAEYKRQDEIDRARCQELAEKVQRGSDERRGLSWWRAAVTSVTGAGRGGLNWSRPLVLAHGR